MPHFVLGIWNGRMFSAFGFGKLQNIAYGLLQGAIALGLFVWEYGIDGLTENGIFAGALLILVIYFLTGQFFYKLFNAPDGADVVR